MCEGTCLGPLGRYGHLVKTTPVEVEAAERKERAALRHRRDWLHLYQHHEAEISTLLNELPISANSPSVAMVCQVLDEAGSRWGFEPVPGVRLRDGNGELGFGGAVLTEVRKLPSTPLPTHTRTRTRSGSFVCCSWCLHTAGRSVSSHARVLLLCATWVWW